MALDRKVNGGRNASRRRFPNRDFSPSAVRRFLSGVLEDWGIDGSTRDTVLLLGSELASNAVEHTAASFTVSIQLAGTQARVDVFDSGAELPTLLQPAVDANHGRGLLLVDGLASAWGASPAPGDKVVWFEVPLGSDGLASLP
jgi:hypothetical protein